MRLLQKGIAVLVITCLVFLPASGMAYNWETFGTMKFVGSYYNFDLDQQINYCEFHGGTRLEWFPTDKNDDSSPVVFRASFKAQSDGFGESGTDVIIGNNGKEPTVSVPEFNFEVVFDGGRIVGEGTVVIGKYSFESAGLLNFDSFKFNPFVSLDFSEGAFQSINKDPVGQWGISITLLDDRLELIALVPNLPYLAIDPDSPHYVEPVAGFSYGDLDQESFYSVGAIFSDQFILADQNIDYSIFVQEGHGNSVIDSKIDTQKGEINLSFDSQFSLGLLTETAVFGWVVRAGIVGYLLDNYQDFALGVIEVEKTIPDVFGGRLLFQISVADIYNIGQDEDVGMPHLDPRRIMDGPTLTGGIKGISASGRTEVEVKTLLNTQKDSTYVEASFVYFLDEEKDLSFKVTGSHTTGNKKLPVGDPLEPEETLIKCVFEWRFKSIF